MRILVTGGAGFIGSHTCTVLIEKGYEVIVIDSFTNSNKRSLEKVRELFGKNKEKKYITIRVIKGDIRDEEKIDKIFMDSQLAGKPIKAVLHFAGLKSVTESVINPFIYWDINLNGTIKLLSIMNKYNCRTIVFSSSATIYGLSGEELINENAKIKPINPYGQTKAAVEKFLNDIYKSCPENWRIANLRYFNPIGAHPSGSIGESPIGIPNNIFPYITQVATGKIKKFTVYGNDWSTKDGTGVRDYIHVMDLAEGHIAALEYLFYEKPQIINLNLGTALGTSVLELINTFQLATNIQIPYEYSSRRKGDVAFAVADNSKAISLLNWYPKRSLKQMCLDGWKWQKSNPKGFTNE